MLKFKSLRWPVLIIKKYTVGITYSRYIIQHVMCPMQSRCWPNGCPKQDGIVVPPSLKYYGSKKKIIIQKNTPTIGVEIEL